MFWITAIREFENRTPIAMEFYRVRTRELVRAAANVDVACNVWIPWCDTPRQFQAGEHIIVRSSAIWVQPYYIFPHPYFWVWQQGDYIRFSTDGQFHMNGDRVPGDAGVDGDRVLQFSAVNGTAAISIRA